MRLYVSDPWYASIRYVGMITNLVVNGQKKPLLGEGFNVVRKGSKLSLKDTKNLGMTGYKWTWKNYIVRFDLKLTKPLVKNRWYSILHVSAKRKYLHLIPYEDKKYNNVRL